MLLGTCPLLQRAVRGGTLPTWCLHVLRGPPWAPLDEPLRRRKQWNAQGLIFSILSDCADCTESCITHLLSPQAPDLPITPHPHSVIKPVFATQVSFYATKNYTNVTTINNNQLWLTHVDADWWCLTTKTIEMTVLWTLTFVCKYVNMM